ncbi:MAG: hypothetical protein R3362_11365, partial [Rhodothermales bacterium]|nr:hypothetical protein [Rhodothermales bacterium]
PSPDASPRGDADFFLSDLSESTGRGRVRSSGETTRTNEGRAETFGAARDDGGRRHAAGAA